MEILRIYVEEDKEGPFEWKDPQPYQYNSALVKKTYYSFYEVPDLLIDEEDDAEELTKELFLRVVKTTGTVLSQLFLIFIQYIAGSS